ncbi:MAG TPA: hypothetical protein VGB91_05375 [Rhizomicrobium sp.]
MNRNLAVFAILMLSAAAAVGVASNGKPAAKTPAKATPVPMPSGYGFPTAKATIDNWVQTNNEAEIRGHAWGVWAAMTSASGEGTLPVWETWLASPDLKKKSLPPGGGALAAVQALRGANRVFATPVQFLHRVAKDQKAHALLKLEAPAQVTRVTERFDPTAATFIMTPHPGPGGTDYKYNSHASLAALNNAWPTGTSAQDRAIVDFPDTAIETKPVFNLVYATGLTPLPYWQGPDNVVGGSGNKNPTEQTWFYCMLIDPATTAPVRNATRTDLKRVPADRLHGLSCKYFKVGPLSLLYTTTLNAAEALSYGHGAKQGDHAAFVAMHVNTKEITFWTWQTFYWQPVADQGSTIQFPGSKSGQPTTLPSPWNNYAMCTNYNQTATYGGTAMDVCFNPYLETDPGIPDGIHSNCMSCHGTATVGNSAGYPSEYTNPIAFFTDPTYFNSSTTHTDFSWEVADE